MTRNGLVNLQIDTGWLLKPTRAQSISSQKQFQLQNAKNSQHRNEQLPYFTSGNSTVQIDSVVLCYKET